MIKIKRLILQCLFIVGCINTIFAQSENRFLTPNGIFDYVSDKSGNQYHLSDLNIQVSKLGTSTVNSVPSSSCVAGNFILWFSPGFLTSGISTSIVCQVLTDVSNYIISPLSSTLTNPNNFKINLFCDAAPSSNFLAGATSFYSYPLNATNPNLGILDGAIYKALTSGQDPYSNLPITFTNSSGFYHGYIIINSTPNSAARSPPSLTQWNQNPAVLPAPNEIDLYSVLLHEVTHALGFATLIDNNGFSVNGSSNNFFSRYDQFLYGASGSPLLSNTTTPFGNDLIFTAPLSDIFTSTSSCLSDVTTCSTAAQYSSSNVHVKVCTPNCWVPGSSLSHFEDMCSTATFTPQAPLGCTPSPTSPGANNLYFVMSNASNVGNCYTKRFLKQEEHLALCDLGYSLLTNYSSTNLSALIDGTASIHYYSTNCIPTNTLIGINDGLIGNNYIFITNSNSISIPTNSLTLNDIPNTVSVTNVSVVYTNTITSATASVSGNNLIVNATTGSGLILVKYYPTNGTITGNATYVFVYFSSNNCNPINSCNMIQNGGFESGMSINTCGTMTSTSGPMVNCWEIHEGSPVVLTRSCSSSGGSYNLGSNTIGSAPTIMNSFNGIGNNRVIALNYSNSNPNNTQVIKTNLGTPLISGNAYRLSFMVANVSSTLSQNNSVNSPVVITIVSNPNFAFVPSGTYPSTLNILGQFTINASTTWTQITHNFTFTSNGNISHTALLIGINPLATASLGVLTSSNSVWCYLDEVSLVSQSNPTFSITSVPICGNQLISDLDVYTSNPSIGSFSGNHVSFANGLYSFNSQLNILSPGNYPVAYTYTAGGCTNTIHDFVAVSTNTNLLTLSPRNLCSPPNSTSLYSLIDNIGYWSGAEFSVNGSTISATSAFSYTLPPDNTYTITAISTNTSLGLCNNIGSTIVNSYTTPTIINLSVNTPTIAPFTTSICPAYSVGVVSVSSNGTVYLWQPGNQFFQNGSFSPTISTIYTLSVYNHSSCPVTHTLSVIVNTNCCPATTNAVHSGSLLSSNQSGILEFHNDVTIPSGNNIILNGEFLFGPNKKLTVSPNSTLTIQGSHLYSCFTNMWKGIVLQDGAALVIGSNTLGTGSLIEDAEKAIYLLNHTTSTLTSILNIKNTVFNKNHTGIEIINYTRSLTTYPFIIDNCVFTSRNLPFTSTAWPQATISDLRSVINPTNGLLPPYIDNSSYSISNLKNPFPNQTAHTAIRLQNVGLTSGSSLYSVKIGTASSANDFNLFDAHGNFIEAINSNLSLENNVFQNTQRYLVPTFVGSTTLTPFGGNAVDARVGNFINKKIKFENTGITTGNRFWDCHTGVNINKVSHVEVWNTLFRSTHSSTALASGTFVPTGQTGINMNTNRFDYFVVGNEFTNISNGINISLIASPQCSNCISSSIFANRIVITNNNISAGTGANNYVDKAINISCPNTTTWSYADDCNWVYTDPIYGASYSCRGIFIGANYLDKVFRGIYLNGISAIQTHVDANEILLADDNVFATSQHGINFSGSISGFNKHQQFQIKSNSVSGGTTSISNPLMSMIYNQNVWGFASAFIPYVICNSIGSSYNGFVFDMNNGGTYWGANVMQPMARGLVLRNFGGMGQQGDAGFSNANHWSGNWNSHNHTYTEDISDGQWSKLFVQNAAGYVPTNNGGPIPIQAYGQLGNINVATGGDFNCIGTPNEREVPIPNEGDFNDNSMKYYYQQQTALYRLLYANDSLRSEPGPLADFYENLAGSNIAKLQEVEVLLYQGDYNAANTLLADIEPTSAHAVETNYKNYYTLYANYLALDSNEIYSQADSAALFELANFCPSPNGACIHQARALYQAIYNVNVNYMDCFEGEPSERKSNNVESKKEDLELNNLTNISNIEIFPNPANSRLYITTVGNSENLEITFKDLTNRTIATRKIKTLNNLGVLDIELINGIYFVTIINDANEKFIKKVLIAK
jgi:hypothetical protein